MGLKKLMLSIILGVLILLASGARADFLGLAPGDYTITLLGSNLPELCGAVAKFQILKLQRVF